MPLRRISRVSGISLSSFCYQEKKRRVKRLSPLIEQDIISTASERPCHGDQYISDIIDRERKIEDQIALAVKDNNEVKLLMTIPGVNIYSAAAIISEIDDISRFSIKEKFASYAGLVPRQDQSGTVNRMGHITKRGPSMLRFILVVAAHTAIRRSNRFRAKYQGIVRRVGRNRAIVAIARILAETIYSMLKKGMEFIDGVDSMTEKKIKSMVSRASSAKKNADVTRSIKLLREKRLRGSPVKLFS